MSLNSEGEDNIMKVIERVYMFTNQIKSEGVKDYIYEEFKQKHEIDFDNMSKSNAIRYANTLGRRLNFMPYETTDEANMAHVDDILYAPYAYLQFSPDDIQDRLSLLTPTNMYVVFTSRTVEKEKEGDAEKFRKEYYYSTEFTVEEMSEETLQRLSVIKPEDGMKLSHAPANVFMPKAEDLINMKAPKVDDKAAVPK